MTEVGVKHRGQMAVSARLLKPDVAVVTSIGTEHHRTLGPVGEIRREKAEMLRQLAPTGLAILNGDDPNVRWMGDQTTAEVRTFGFDVSNDVRASNYVSVGLSGGQFLLQAQGVSQRVKTKLVGRHMVYSLLAAVTVGLAEGVDLETVLRAIENLPPTPHRLHVGLPTGGPSLLMDDYKMVFETVERALDALAELPARRRIVVLGEVYEPPGEEDEIYRHTGRRLAQTADRLIFVGETDQFRGLCEGAAQTVMTSMQASHAGRSVLRAADLVGDRLAAQDVVLVKATDSQRLERLELLLAGRNVTCDRETCKAPITYACADCRLLCRPRKRRLRSRRAGLGVSESVRKHSA